MAIILSMDAKDYEGTVKVYEKYAVRAVVRRAGQIAMQRAASGYYKLLGGGIEPGEHPEDTLRRELQEEGGMSLAPDSIREIGEIVELHRDLFDESAKFVCHTSFYFCDVTEEKLEMAPTTSEIREGFRLCWVSPEEAISANEAGKGRELPWVRRDTAFLRMLTEGGLSAADQ